MNGSNQARRVDDINYISRKLLNRLKCMCVAEREREEISIIIIKELHHPVEKKDRVDCEKTTKEPY